MERMEPVGWCHCDEAIRLRRSLSVDRSQKSPLVTFFFSTQVFSFIFTINELCLSASVHLLVYPSVCLFICLSPSLSYACSALCMCVVVCAYVCVQPEWDGWALLTFTKLIRIVHILVSSYTVSNPWFTDCASSWANSWLLKIFKLHPLGILQTVVGWKPWW